MNKEEVEGLRTHVATTLATQYLLVEFIATLIREKVVSREQYETALSSARARLEALGTPEALRACVVLEGSAGGT